MSRGRSPKTFLNYVRNFFSEQYFHQKADQLGLHQRNPAQVYTGRVLSASNRLPTAGFRTVQSRFSTMHGPRVRALPNQVSFRGLELADGCSQTGGHYDRALRAPLDGPHIFPIASRFRQKHRQNSWRPGRACSSTKFEGRYRANFCGKKQAGLFTEVVEACSKKIFCT